MPIRYQCEDCGSVLKIKDELAGTEGRCPKCRREFVVPPAGSGTEATAAPSSAEAGDDFDPVAFLMDGGDSPARPKPVAAEQRQVPAAPSETVQEQASPERRSKRLRVPPTESAAESADAMLGGTASSNAKQLLTRSMEESRVRAAEMPEDEEEPGVDYGELGKLIGLQVLPGIAAILVVTFGIYWLVSGWLSSDNLPELGRVSGVVTLNGAPLAGAQITFTPLDVDASSAMAIIEEDGEYTLYYQEDVRGAVVGKNRVRIFAIDDRGREVIAADAPYGMASNEIWIVEPGSQRIDINAGEHAPSLPADE